MLPKRCVNNLNALIDLLKYVNLEPVEIHGIHNTPKLIFLILKHKYISVTKDTNLSYGYEINESFDSHGKYIANIYNNECIYVNNNSRLTAKEHQEGTENNYNHMNYWCHNFNSVMLHAFKQQHDLQRAADQVTYSIYDVKKNEFIILPNEFFRASNCV
jgi:hypothetical protein